LVPRFYGVELESGKILHESIIEPPEDEIVVVGTKPRKKAMEEVTAAVSQP
jgi:uncharacterized protein YabE (DUF348 family)